MAYASAYQLIVGPRFWWRRTQRASSLSSTSISAGLVVMSHTSYIFRLHDDLLEYIFSTLVLTDIASKATSPVCLSQVCRRWRYVAQSLARLWTRINMNSPNPDRFFALSGTADLRVSWNTVRSFGAGPEWIWAHALRFRELVFEDYEQETKQLLLTYGVHLRNLHNLSVLVRELSWRPLHHIRLKFELPKLVALSLEGFQVSMRDLLSLIGSASALRVASLSRLQFSDIHEFDQSHAATTAAAPPRHRGLRELSLSKLGTEAQGVLLNLLSLPSLRLNLTEYVKEPNGGYNDLLLLHPAVEAALGRLDFTTLLLRSDSTELHESDSDLPEAYTDLTGRGGAQSAGVTTKRSRCTLSLRVPGTWFPNLLGFPAPFPLPTLDLSRVRTLVLNDVVEVDVLAWGTQITQCLRAVSKLVLHNSSWLGKALVGMNELREIRVGGAVPVRDGLLRQLVEGIRQRKLAVENLEGEQGGAAFRPVERVVFERCTRVEGNIALLRKEVDVIFIE